MERGVLLKTRWPAEQALPMMAVSRIFLNIMFLLLGLPEITEHLH